MPRKPNATRPNANTGAASMIAASPYEEMMYETPIRATMVNPNQYAEKLPATKPERIPSDAPPSRADVTTSFVCRDSTEVKTFTSSGIIAPASVPHEIIVASFHH